MSQRVLDTLRGQIEKVKEAPIYSKPAEAEKALGMALAVMTDFENRLIELERKANDKA